MLCVSNPKIGLLESQAHKMISPRSKPGLARSLEVANVAKEMAAPENLIIRIATADDLSSMDMHEPIPGLSACGHRAVLDAETDTLLVAEVDQVLRGHVYIRWSGFETPAFAAAEPQTPVMNGLAIWPLAWRNRGVGTALVSTVERAVTEKNFDRVGLGLYVNNEGARRFYERLGYREWDRTPVSVGNPNQVPALTMLTKGDLISLRGEHSGKAN